MNRKKNDYNTSFLTNQTKTKRFILLILSQAAACDNNVANCRTSHLALTCRCTKPKNCYSYNQRTEQILPDDILVIILCISLINYIINAHVV